MRIPFNKCVAGYLLAAGLIFGIMATATCLSIDGKKLKTIDILDRQDVQVETIGWSFWGCGEDDNIQLKWTGTDDKGIRVEGYSCSGLLKGVTIRYK